MKDPVVVPTLVEGASVLAEAVVGDGPIRLRLTHPNMWRALQVFAALNFALGLNFVLLHPTFLIYSTSNYVWGAVFLTLGAAKIVFTNLYHNLRLVRLTMGAEVGYMLFIMIGACEPYVHGVGSLQNPILYLGVCAFEFLLLLEPFINPWTAKRK